jgi:2-iminobutanoate/2-iminopropanoate deaminase
MKFLIPEDARLGGHYSSAVMAGPFVFTAGQVPRDGDRNIMGGTIAEQTVAALKNVENILREAKARLTDVVQVRVHLSDLSLAPEFNRAYSEFFGSHRPARTVVGSQLNGVMVEIDAIAYVTASS